MKKSLFYIVGIIAIISGPFVANAQGAFPDVEQTHDNFKAIEFLQENEIIKGYPDGTFKPEQTINRAEALKIVLLANEYLGRELEVESFKDMQFQDLDESEWYYGFVRLAFSADIVEGYEDGTFKPGQNINAVESIKIILKTMEEGFAEYEVNENPYSDVDFESWYATYVDYTKSKNFTEPLEQNNFEPAREMSRSDFAEIIYRLIYTEENNLEEFPISHNWQFCSNPEDGYKIKKPKNWQIIQAGDHLIFWRRDIKNNQVSFARVFPNSGVVYVVLDENPKALSLSQYVQGIDYGEGSKTRSLELNGIPYYSVELENIGIADSYFELENDGILNVYSQVGSGEMKDIIQKEIRYLLGSIRNSNSQENLPLCLTDQQTELGREQDSESSSNELTTEELISNINELVLEEGQANQVLQLLDDSVIIETDSIGIGTGPVDYIYSEKLNVTIKLERDTNTILAVKNEKTTLF